VFIGFREPKHRRHSTAALVASIVTICEAEARQASRGSGGGHPRRATRLRS
jgi:hypothetical protein